MKSINRRLRELRLSLGLSQEAIGAQGFVSTPGWTKIENGSRQPSDVLAEKLVGWLIKDQYLSAKQGDELLEELLTLKYMDHISGFVRRLAWVHYRELQGRQLKVAEGTSKMSSLPETKSSYKRARQKSSKKPGAK